MTASSALSAGPSPLPLTGLPVQLKVLWEIATAVKSGELLDTASLKKLMIKDGLAKGDEIDRALDFLYDRGFLRLTDWTRKDGSRVQAIEVTGEATAYAERIRANTVDDSH